MATTVTSSIGSAGGRTYSTPALWEAAAPASLTTADQIWRGECYTDSIFTVAGTVVTIAGSTSDVTRYKELTVATGQSLCDQPAASTALRFQTSTLGVVLRNTSSYLPAVDIQENYARFSRIQCTSTAASGRPIEVNTGTTGVRLENCVFSNSSGGQTRIEGTSTQITNCLFQFTGSAAQIRTTGSPTFLNCTIVGDNTASDAFNSTYFVGTIKNCAVFGFANDMTVSSGTTRTANGTDDTTPSGGFTGSIAYTTATFVVVHSLFGDFRLPSGSALIALGTATGAPATDFFGTARGASIDVGCFQTASGGGGSGKPMNHYAQLRRQGY